MSGKRFTSKLETLAWKIFCWSCPIMKTFGSCHLIFNGNRIMTVSAFMNLRLLIFFGWEILLLHQEMLTYLLAISLRKHIPAANVSTHTVHVGD